MRAIFNNAAFLIPGEDVKVAGAKVGKVDSLDVTPDLKAAAVLAITEPGFQDFRNDAECAIRPQSVIGEKLVECMPTQPRAEGTPRRRRSRRSDGRAGAGQYLLPVEQHHHAGRPRPDQQRHARCPTGQRFAIILNEFGAGLAGRGKDLRRGDPGRQPGAAGVRQGHQDPRQAEQGARRAGAKTGDKVLAPLARERKHVADAIVQAEHAAQATAERSADLEKNFELFPKFLRELQARRCAARPAVATQMPPVFTDLSAVAQDISRLLIALGPFSHAGIPALQVARQDGRRSAARRSRRRGRRQDLGASQRGPSRVARDLAALLEPSEDGASSA